VIVFILAVILFFRTDERRAIFDALSLGTMVHVFLDFLVIRTDAMTPPYLYPLTWAPLPSGGIYLSSDIWYSLIALLVSGIILYLD
jgi:hypothetical protein